MLDNVVYEPAEARKPNGRRTFPGLHNDDSSARAWFTGVGERGPA